MSKNIEMIKARIDARFKERRDTPHDNIRAIKEAEIDGMISVLHSFGYSVFLDHAACECVITKA